MHNSMTFDEIAEWLKTQEPECEREMPETLRRLEELAIEEDNAGKTEPL